ncbi:uncharacterized protein LOC118647535 [Monomorium pharaonis]|uniref:uncharacterized protein LOC118647535 n=1 Tax=Monomorium pharaonis TaxID=307658 RepID=UPI0017466A7B|nr:uncharacterized protein LOC118647535 [Monomorium pharaonis]
MSNNERQRDGYERLTNDFERFLNQQRTVQERLSDSYRTMQDRYQTTRERLSDGYRTAVNQKILKKHDINHYSSYSVMKASVVEQFNRTLKNDMWKMFTLNGNYKWIDLLPELVSNYNTRKHQTIGMRPIDVTPAVAERLLDTVYSSIKIAGPAKFKVGDSVRVSKFKTVFEKSYTPNWTTEVFKIIKVQRTNPVTYLLEDYRGTSIAGAFYEHELRRATHPDVFLVEKVLRRKGDKVYVKWLGFDGSHNSWIHKDNVI